MQEKLVSFDTGKLAKEKGFNWNTDYYYRSNSKVYFALYYDSTPNNLTIIEDWMSGDTDENELVKVCTAPTQSLLQKWLREVHNIHIDIGWIPKNDPDLEPFEVFWWYLVGLIEKQEINYFMEDTSSYNTYEEALEVALPKALKLI